MGARLGFIAAKVSVPALQAAVLRAWPFAVVASKEAFENAESMWLWKKANEKFVSAADSTPFNRGKSVLALWQDGAWSVLADWDVVMPQDEDRLASLSSEIGEVLALAIVSAGGSAQALYFKDGKLLRQIGDFGGDRIESGAPLPQEANFKPDRFYGHEEEFWTAFGLAPFEDTPGEQGLRAISVVDQTDYGQLVASSSPNPKPWWKFW